MDDFASKSLEDWDEIAEQTGLRDYVFRGQTDSSWGLSTSLERQCRRLELDNVQETEEFLIREFQRRYHHYSDSVPDLTKGIEWLSIMQHHGAPTRLLDWTYSPLVGCYFAVEGGTDESALWRINAKWCLEQAIANAGWTASDKLASPGWEEADMAEVSQALMGTKEKPFVRPVTPFRLNPRLSVQQGTFLWCGDVERSFEDNLRSMEGYDKKENIIKFVIPKTLGLKAIKELYRANVTRASLFPGLDGFAQALGVSWLVSSESWVWKNPPPSR
jgi:FRG domain